MKDLARLHLSEGYQCLWNGFKCGLKKVEEEHIPEPDSVASAPTDSLPSYDKITSKEGEALLKQEPTSSSHCEIESFDSGTVTSDILMMASPSQPGKVYRVRPGGFRRRRAGLIRVRSDLSLKRRARDLKATVVNWTKRILKVLMFLTGMYTIVTLLLQSFGIKVPYMHSFSPHAGNITAALDRLEGL
jgi:hypothetical protein